MAIGCPYMAIFLFILNRNRETKEDKEDRSVHEDEFARRVLESEQDLFREEEDGTGSLGWQIVQLYRTFLLNLFTVFFTNPLYRSLGE